MLQLCTTAKDITRLQKEHKIGGILEMEFFDKKDLAKLAKQLDVE